MITSNKIILVEGKDEVEFISALCEREQLQSYQIIEVGGVDRFKDELPIIMNHPNFDDVNSLTIIRDADKSRQSAIQSLQSHLRKLNLPVPKEHASVSIDNTNGLKVGIYIMPGNRDSGMLECLVLDSVSEHPVKMQADLYIQRIKDELPFEKFPKNEHKATLHAYLAGMRELVPSLGIATKKGYFNLDSEHFIELKTFLNEMLNT